MANKWIKVNDNNDDSGYYNNSDYVKCPFDEWYWREEFPSHYEWEAMELEE